MNNTDRLELAKRAARAAGEMLLGYDALKVERKALNDFVTDADRASEELIREMLLSAFPDDGFYGEEGGESEKPAAGRWIVDPIDGTTNFIKGLPLYTVSIAYEAGGEILLGAVYCPPTGEMYEAALGGGAFLNGRPICVSDEADPARAVVGMSFAHRSREHARRMMSILPALTGGLNDLRRLGSAALDLCHVACGRYDAFLELNLNLYDIAAGVLIAREAGGKVTGWPGEPDCLITGNVLASNGLIHGWLSENIK